MSQPYAFSLQTAEQAFSVSIIEDARYLYAHEHETHGCAPALHSLDYKSQMDASSKEDLLQAIAILEARNKILEERGKLLAQELDLFRQRRLVYWSDRFRNKFDAWHLMHPSFEGLKDDTVIFQGELKNFRLLPSVNLVRVSSICYPIDLGRAGLSAILLAPIIDMPSMRGEICLRIIGPANEVEREVVCSLSELSEDSPCEFRFPPLGRSSEQRLTVHIFVQNVDVPVRIFELRSYPLFGFARLKRKLFAGYRFS